MHIYPPIPAAASTTKYFEFLSFIFGACILRIKENTTAR